MKYLLGISLFLFLHGCTSCKFLGNLENPVGLSISVDEDKRWNDYSQVYSLEYYLWGLIPGEQSFNLSTEVSLPPSFKKGNVVIEEYQTWLDILKTLSSFGIYYPVSYRISYQGEKL